MLFGKGRSDDPLTLLQEGKYRQAAKVLEARLQRTPHDFSLKMRLAEAYEGDGRKEDAAEVYLKEAEASLSGGDRSQGLALLKKAAKLHPANEAIMDRLAQLEAQASSSDSQAFSFDVDMSAPAAPEEGQVTAQQGEPEASLVTEAELLGEVSPEEISTATSEVVAGEETGFAMPEVSGDEVGAVLVAPEGAGGDAAAAPKEPVSAAVQPAAEDEGAVLLGRLFPELDPAHLALLRSAARSGRVQAGQVLIREEESGDSLFVVMEGNLEARGTFDGQVIPLATFGPGDVIGEVAFLKRVPRTATVTALEPSLLLELPGDQMRAQFAEFPEVQLQLDSILNRRVEMTLQLVKQMDKGNDGHT